MSEAGPGAGSVRCDLCGAARPEQSLTWTMSVEHGRTRHYCDRCSRDNLRSIEGRLDAEWFPG